MTSEKRRHVYLQTLSVITHWYRCPPGHLMVAITCPLCLHRPNHEHIVPYLFFPAHPPQTSWVHQCICMWWALQPTCSCVTTDSLSHANCVHSSFWVLYYRSTVHPQYNPPQREIEKFLKATKHQEHLRKLKNSLSHCLLLSGAALARWSHTSIAFASGTLCIISFK